jgi:branched-chain amino acid transport system substrate-binding protein
MGPREGILMKIKLTSLVTAALVVLSMSPAIAGAASAAPTPKPNAACTKANTSAKFGAVFLNCSKVKTKLVWVVVKPKPAGACLHPNATAKEGSTPLICAMYKGKFTWLVKKADIYLGAVLSLTGTFATFEVPAYNGLRVGVDEINANGGVLGHKLVLNVADTGSDASKVVLAAQKIMTDHQISFMAPDVVGDLGKMVLQYTNVQKIISMSSGNVVGADDPKLYPYHFLIYPNSNRQLPAYVAGLEQLGGGATKLKLAIITDTESNDMLMADAVTKAVTADGGDMVSRSNVSNTAQDLMVQVVKAQSAGANVVFVRSVAGVCRATGDAVSSIGWTSVKVLVSTACVNTAVFGAVAQNIAANYYGMSDQMTTRDLGSSTVKAQYVDYVKALKAYGAITNLEVSANYTDGIRMLAWAMEKSGSTDGDKLKAALETLGSTPLPAGTNNWTPSPGWTPASHSFLGNLSNWWALAQPGAQVDGTYQGVRIAGLHE